MRITKKTVGVVVTLAVAVGLVVIGAVDLQTSRHLAAEGKKVTAEVVNKGVTSRAKGRKDYYLEVQYHTETGQTLTQRASVGVNTFESLNRGSTLPLHYLPSQPDVFALGASVRPNYFNLLMGLLFFAIAGIYFLFGKERETVAR